MNKVLTLLVAIWLSACSTAYQPEGFSGGFSETQLDKSAFEVSFAGNGYTSSQRARDFALLRSADLTKKNGYSFFIIVDRSSDTSNSTYTTPSSSTTNIYGNSNGNSFYGTANTNTYGGQTYNFAKPSSTNTIMMFSEKPQIQGIVYDANIICDSVGKNYGVTCGKY